MENSQLIEASQVEALQQRVKELEEEVKQSKEDKELKKINAAIDLKLADFKKQQLELNILSAHKVYEEAAENEKLALEEREERVQQLREAKIEREKKNLVQYIRQVKYLIEQKQYPQDFFASTNTDPATEELRAFYYQLLRDAKDPEAFVNEFVEKQRKAALKSVY